VVKFEVRWRNDRLRAVVGFARNGKNGLLREGGISLLRFRRVGRSGIERRHIFLGRIGYKGCPVEGGVIKNFLLPDPGER